MGAILNVFYSLNHRTTMQFAPKEVTRIPDQFQMPVQPDQWQHGKDSSIHIHSIWRLWNALYVFGIDVGARLNGFIASTTALCLGLLEP